MPGRRDGSRSSATTGMSIAARMDQVNPIYIPRNHIVEEVLTAASWGDHDALAELLDVVTHPFDERPGLDRYAQPAPDRRRRLPHLLRHLSVTRCRRAFDVCAQFRVTRPTGTATQTGGRRAEASAGDAETDVAGGAVGSVRAAGAHAVAVAVRVVAQVRPAAHHPVGAARRAGGIDAG